MDASSASDSHDVDQNFQQAEFFAEDELVEITPMMRSPTITLLRGNFGPFEPSVTTKVRPHPPNYYCLLSQFARPHV